MYHLGRPGHELIYLQRVFHAWGIDGHNSHTNVCSASARAGYAFWHGLDRPSPDHSQRALHPAALLAPRGRPLLQPARPAHHRRQDGGGQDLRGRHAAQQHRLDGRLLALALAGQRGRAAAGHRPLHAARRHVGPRVRPPLGELGGVPARGAPGPAGDHGRLRGGAQDPLRLLHARVRGARVRGPRGPHRGGRPRGRPRGERAVRPTCGATRPPAISTAGRSRGRSSWSWSSRARWPPRAAPRPAGGTRRSRPRR